MVYTGLELTLLTESSIYVSIIVSSDLSWTNYILYIYIAAQAYKILGLLRQFFYNCNSIHSKKLFYINYISLVKSQLIYGSQVWRPHLLYIAIKNNNNKLLDWDNLTYSMPP